MTTGERAGAERAQGFGSRGRGRTFALYGAMTAAALVLLNFILRAGDGLAAPEASGGTEAASGHGSIDTHEVLWKFLLAAALIVVLSRLVGGLFRRIHQPQVMGEIVAGVLLGPSLLGVVFPGISSGLFSEDVLPFIEIVAQLGLIFFMFLIGLELDVRLIRGRGQAATMVSHVSIVAPFLLGAGLALVIFPQLGSADGDFVPFALFLGASMSITAFPVLARILTERGLYKTRLGAVTITCAAVDDVTAWCLLAVVVAVASANGLGGAFVTIALSVIFIAFMLLVVRPLVARLAQYHEERGGFSGSLLSVLLVGILLSALATDRIGIHAIFGAFLFGAIMPQRSEFVHELLGKLEDFTVLFLLPLFFAYSGLRTEIGLIGSDPELWMFCGLILLVAIAGKWGGSTLAARFVGLSWRESMALGVLMNCRGLTELVILNIGLDLGVIPPALFAMLVIMALVTTFMTTPLLSAVYSREEQERMIAEESDEEREERPWRVLVPIAKLDHAYELVHIALGLAGSEARTIQVVLLRALQMPTGYSELNPFRQQARTERATAALRPLVDFIQGAGHDAVPLVITSDNVAETIVRVAEERDPDLILMDWRKPLWGQRLLDGSIGEVVQQAGVDVAVLVDPTGAGLSLRKGSELLVPYGGGFHEDIGFDLALRLARSSGASVRLVGATGTSHDLAERAAQAYERTGVWTATTPVDDVASSLGEHVGDAALIVLGVSDEWAGDQSSLGQLREAIAARSTTPLLIVRRHGQRRQRGPARWLRNLTRRDWLHDSTGELEVDLREQREAEAAKAAPR